MELTDTARLVRSIGQDTKMIAARPAQQRPFNYGGKPPAAEPDTAAVFVSAAEAIGWIAYGRISALKDDPPGTSFYFERWRQKPIAGGDAVERRDSAIRSLRTIIARVRWWQRNKRSGQKYRNLPPVHPVERALVRWAMQHHKCGANALIASLRADTWQFRAAETAHEDAIVNACNRLTTEAAAGNIVALGRRRTGATDDHEPIPKFSFANAENTIRPNGRAGVKWHDVNFEWADVMHLWPAEGSATKAVDVDKAPISAKRIARWEANRQKFKNTPQQGRIWIPLRELLDYKEKFPRVPGRGKDPLGDWRRIFDAIMNNEFSVTKNKM